MKSDAVVLEKYIYRVVGKKAWDMCIMLTGMHAVEVDGCLQYVNMPLNIEEMLIDHIINHPYSRLSMAYVSREGGIKFNTEKLTA